MDVPLLWCVAGGGRGLGARLVIPAVVPVRPY